MAASCSHWWHAPVYFTLATVLAITAISSFPPPTHQSTTSSDATIFSTNATSLEIYHNASATLRSQGFSIIATLLKLSPEMFLSSSSSSSSGGTGTTIFALPDSVLANCSLPHWAQKLVLQYHTVPTLNLPFRSLLRKSSNTCLATAIPSKNIALTKIKPQERLIEINNAAITHPDLFLHDSLSIHGVLAPFTTLDSHITLDFIHSPPCSFPSPSPSSSSPIIWNQIMGALSSHDFVSFAVGLNSVLQGIIQDHSELNSGTIFAPKELGLVDSPQPLLRQLVRYHIIPERYEFADLASLPEKTRFKTLVSGKDLEITAAFKNATQKLSIGGVEVTMPDVCSTSAFIVHAISRPFHLDDNANL